MEATRKYIAEFLGTFWLVFAGCGSALLAAGFLTDDKVHMGIGFVGVSLAFGLTVVSMAYAIGHISGAHLNPAVTLGAFMAGRIHVKDVVPYFIAQFLGGVVAAFLLFFICSGAPGYVTSTFAGVCNGYGDVPGSPGKYSMIAAFTAEAVFTFMFLMVILGSTDWRASAGFAGLAIGLCLTLIHLGLIPVTNCSVNPARSLGPAVVALVNGEAWPMQQVWLFFAAPAAGAALAGVVYRSIFHVPNPDA